MGDLITSPTPWWAKSSPLKIENNELTFAGKSLRRLAEQLGTPFFAFDVKHFRSNYTKLRELMKAKLPAGITSRLYYAAKANSSTSYLAALVEEQGRIDATSINEVKRAIRLGIRPEDIIFTGINLDSESLKFLTSSGVLMNVDSFSQIRRLAQFGAHPISIRWNPQIAVGSHSGLQMSGSHPYAQRLGVPNSAIIEAFVEARKLGLQPIGLHQHLGSNIFQKDLPALLRSVELALKLIDELHNDYGITLKMLDLGGGMGVQTLETGHQFPWTVYLEELSSLLSSAPTKPATVALEPGRSLAADTGVLVARINSKENKSGFLFLGVDAGFNLLNHRVLFGIESEVLACRQEGQPTEECYVGGNLCEPGDIFAEQRAISRSQESDLLAFFPAGAYSVTEMAQFHLRDLPKRIYLSAGEIIKIEQELL